MFVVDTNVLAYAANPQVPEHSACLARLDMWRRQPAPWYLTWNILYEFCRVVTHPRVIAKPFSAPEAWTYVASLLESPGVRMLTHGAGHGPIATEVASSVPGLRGNLVFDAHTVALMREHGVRRIWTSDADFYRFPGIEVLDPLREDI